MCISIDSKYIIGNAIKKTGECIIRVWDASSVLNIENSEEIDITNKYLWENSTKKEYGFSQGIYSDGRFIYGLTGDSITYITCLTLTGDLCFARPTYAYRSHEFSDFDTKAEPEGIFWAPYYGTLELFLAISLAVYHKDDDGWDRYNRYWGLSLPGDSNFENQNATDTRIIDLNDATNPGYYAFESNAINTPNNITTPGYIHVLRGNRDTWKVVQIAYIYSVLGGNRQEIVYIRSGNKDFSTGKLINGTEWQLISSNLMHNTGKGYHVLAPVHGPQEVGQTSSSYEIMRLYHFRDINRDPTYNSYGFISRFSTQIEPNTDYVPSQM